VTLYAATGDAVARLRERDGVWRADLLLEGTGAQCLAVASGSEPQSLLVGCRGNGIRHSDDAGASWSDLGLPERDVFSVAVSPADGALYAGCEPSRLFRSRDGGGTWEALDALLDLPSRPTWSFPPRPWTSHVRWIAPSPRDADVLLVGIELGGLMRTTDGGRTWEDHRPGAQPDVHAIAWHPTAAGRAYEAGGGGAAWSVDGGATWRAADDGRDRHYTWALAVDPGDPDTWFVSASHGPFDAHGADRHAQAFIYRRRGDGPWVALSGGLPQPLDAMPYALTFAGGRLFAGLRDGRLYASADGGDSWAAQRLEGAEVGSITALAG
jgi:photosystem II stability/assembly factor-like uncharacterized protein